MKKYIKVIRMFEVNNFNTLTNSDFEKLEDMDRIAFNRYGVSFSKEIWKKENFIYRLPNKYDYSYVIKESERIIGYCVASNKNDSIYIHRFVVRHNSKNVSNYFFNYLLNNSYVNNDIYLMVNIINNNAISFYENFFFEDVNDLKEIKKFVLSDLKIEKNKIIIDEDYKCYLMKKNKRL